MSHSLLLELKKWLPRPLLWVLWGLCCLVISLFFYRLCVDYLHLAHKALAQDAPAPSVTLHIIKPLSSWSIILFALLLPIFTTSAFSQEYHQRTFTLWALSPCSSHSIVWGKFLGILLFPVSMMTVQLMMLSALAFETPLEVGCLITSFLVMFLIATSLTAFGLFISSFMSNPLFAMTLTFLGTLVWMLLEWLNPLPSYFSLLNQHLCLLSHSYHLLNGTLYSTDIAFYGISTLIFLILTQQVIHYKMRHYHVA